MTMASAEEKRAKFRSKSTCDRRPSPAQGLFTKYRSKSTNDRPRIASPTKRPILLPSDSHVRLLDLGHLSYLWVSN